MQKSQEKTTSQVWSVLRKDKVTQHSIDYETTLHLAWCIETAWGN